MSTPHASSRPLLISLAGLLLAATAALMLTPAPDVRADDHGAVAASAGADLFAQNCAACHGPTGGGDGPAAAGLDPKPRKLSSKDVMEKIPDAQILGVIKKGGAASGKSPLMPAFANLTDDQVKSLLAHIRALCGCSYKP